MTGKNNALPMDLSVSVYDLNAMIIIDWFEGYGDHVKNPFFRTSANEYGYEQ